MGKKSHKRNRGSRRQDQAVIVDSRPVAPALRRRNGKEEEEEEKETKDNLRFQDPFIEEFRNDDDDDDDGDDKEWEDMQEDEDEDEDADDGGGKIGGTRGRGDGARSTSTGEVATDSSYEVIHSWNPLTGQALQPGQQLEMDASAYKMHHAIRGEWPALTFDFLQDDLGDHRTRFPHSLIFATGTQADRSHENSLCIMKLSDLARMPQENQDDDDILGEEYDNDNDNDKVGADDDSSSSDEDDDDDIDLDPIVEHYNVKHVGGVNRLRCMPQRSNIIATWSDTGKVNLFNVESILERFAVSQGTFSTTATVPPGAGAGIAAMSAMPTKPFFSYSKHSTEGYAMDWSKVQEGALVTGDCHGNIHLWAPRGGDAISYSVTPSYHNNRSSSTAAAAANDGQSIEDLQWSPKEATVFASAECNGFVRIFDTRASGRAMLSYQIHAPNSSSFGSNDVNVLSWNALVSNLLATGSDSGILSVWDLRKFSNNNNESSSSSTVAVSPLARFSPHKTPITSVEWHPTDESMLAMTDDMGAYIYDLSVEEDNKPTTSDGDDYQVLATSKDIPPQLLFVHSGSEQFKEVHWHAQIPSCLMTTALSGYSVFIPSNL